LFLNKNTPKAIEELQRLYEYFPNSEYAPKALFALGWIYEKSYNESAKAIEMYREIIQKYPDSEYSKTIKRKLDEVEKAASEAGVEKQKAAQTPATKAEEPAPSLVSDKKDSTRTMNVSLPDSQAVQDSVYLDLRQVRKVREQEAKVNEDKTNEKKAKP